MRGILLLADLRASGFAWREDDLLARMDEWAKLLSWAEIEREYWTATDSDDCETTYWLELQEDGALERYLRTLA